ncbi:tetratricopeptide repeat protein [Singulisphaera sp. PoT]|uniref:tetratricopeptide repeat protein n=1 Tax=Singulisphaera sp. PoT TaxID=3411797 RepID=UPI003BF4E65A
MSEADRPTAPEAKALAVSNSSTGILSDPRFWAFALPLFIIVALAFLPILGNGFVYFDDDENFLGNRNFRGLGFSQLGWAWTTLLLGVYQPLAWILLEVQYVLFGLNPWGYHLASLLLHALNSVVALALTYSILRRSAPELVERYPRRAYGCSALAILLYAIHPLRVEVVAWASCQPYLPCVLFYMLSILAYLQAADLDGSKARSWQYVSWAMFLCALLSKAVAVSLPVVLMALDFFPLRRFEDRSRIAGVLREKAFYLAASAAFVLIAVVGKQSNESLRTIDDSGLWARLAQSGYGFWFYLLKSVAPVNLVAYYPLPKRAEFWGPTYLVAVGASVGLFLVIVRHWKAHPGLLTTGLAYLASLAPNLGFVTIGNQLVADRYCYLPALALAVGLAFLLLRWTTAPNLKGRPWVEVVPGLLFSMALLPLTWQQCRSWKTTEALWVRVLENGDRQHPTPYFNLGADQARRKRYDQAMANYREALELDPNSPDANNLLGAALDALGKPDEAFAYYRKAVKLEPIYPDARNNLGSALAREGNLREAVAQFSEAVRQRPEFPLAQKNLGLALSRLGRLREASTALTKATRLAPEDPELWQLLAVSQAKLGRLDDAIEAFSKALALRPDSGGLERDIGLALEQKERLDEAISHYAAAVRHEPSLVDNRILLGSALARRGRLDDARLQFQEGLKLEPENPELRRSLDGLGSLPKP